MIFADQIRPNSTWVLIRKCFNDDVKDDSGSVVVYLPDPTKEDTNWVEILAIGPKCRTLTQDEVGGMVMAPDFSHDLMRVSDRSEELFMIREAKLCESGVLVKDY